MVRASCLCCREGIKSDTSPSISVLLRLLASSSSCCAKLVLGPCLDLPAHRQLTLRMAHPLDDAGGAALVFRIRSGNADNESFGGDTESSAPYSDESRVAQVTIQSCTYLTRRTISHPGPTQDRRERCRSGFQWKYGHANLLDSQSSLESILGLLRFLGISSPSLWASSSLSRVLRRFLFASIGWRRVSPASPLG